MQNEVLESLGDLRRAAQGDQVDARHLLDRDTKPFSHDTTVIELQRCTPSP